MRAYAVPVAIVALAGIAAQAQPPQNPIPTFRSGADVVQIDVSVLDKDRMQLPSR